MVIWCKLNTPRCAGVEVRESYLVLRSDLMPNDDLIDIVELVPVIVLILQISEKRLEFWTSRYGHIKCLSREEAPLVEKIEIIFVHKVAKKLVGKPVEIGHDRKSQPPEAVGGPIDHLGVLERLVIVEPIEDRIVFFLVEFDLDCFKRLDIKDIVSVVQRRFFVVKGRESHSFEMAAIAFLAPHHDPHRAPLCGVHRLDDLRDLVHKGNGACDVVKSFDVANLLPWHGHVFEQLVYGMGYILKSTQVNSLVLSKSLR
jgi:hypothetical protein